MLNLMDLTDIQEIEKIKHRSFEKPQIIFKHSTSCGISSVALNRFKNSDEIAEGDYYLLNLRKYRDVSNAVASEFKVMHESPQIIVVKNGEVIYTDSHFGIDMQDVVKATNS